LKHYETNRIHFNFESNDTVSTLLEHRYLIFIAYFYYEIVNNIKQSPDGRQFGRYTLSIFIQPPCTFLSPRVISSDQTLSAKWQTTRREYIVENKRAFQSRGLLRLFRYLPLSTVLLRDVRLKFSCSSLDIQCQN